MKILRALCCGLALMMQFKSAQCQQGGNVLWSSRVEYISGHEANLIISAMISPDWHLYSQHLRGDGPLPTLFSFIKDSRYQMSAFSEKGNPQTYYDDTYKLDVTWYSTKVEFISRLKLSEPVLTLNGSIEYMTCNAYACVPAKVSMTIEVDLTKRTP